MHRAGWSTSTTESAKPKAVARNRRSEWQVQKQRTTVRGMHRTGWSTAAGSVKPKAAASKRLSELQVRKRRSTVHSTPWTGMVDVCRKKCKIEDCGKRAYLSECTARPGRNRRRLQEEGFHRSEWQVQKQWSTVRSMHRDGMVNVCSKEV